MRTGRRGFVAGLLGLLGIGAAAGANDVSQRPSEELLERFRGEMKLAAFKQRIEETCRVFAGVLKYAFHGLKAKVGQHNYVEAIFTVRPLVLPGPQTEFLAVFDVHGEQDLSIAEIWDRLSESRWPHSHVFPLRHTEIKKEKLIKQMCEAQQKMFDKRCE